MGKPTIDNYKMLAAAIVGQNAEDLCCCEYVEKNIKNNVVAKFGVTRAIRPYVTEYNNFMSTYFSKMKHLKRCLLHCSNPETIRKLNLDIVNLKNKKKYLQLKADKGLARAVILYLARNEKDNLLIAMNSPKFHIISDIDGDAIAYRAKKSVYEGRFKRSRSNPIYFTNTEEIRREIDKAAKEIVSGRHTYQEAIA